MYDSERKPMVLAGLGNPGRKYKNTWHNVGFVWIDKFYNQIRRAGSYTVTDWKHKDKLQSWICEVKKDAGLTGQARVAWVLVKPATYMNRSGAAVQQVVKKYDIAVNKDLIVIHDDLDIDLGKYKLHKAKGPRGHNGIISINSTIGTNYWRVRLGIDNRDSGDKISGKDFVLERMSSAEKEELNEAIKKSIKIVIGKFSD
jgi:peptidyl-tRNA hydrolase, PTH1 family